MSTPTGRTRDTPSFAVHDGFRIDVPAARGRVLDAGGHTLGHVGDTYTYPVLRAGADDELDVRFVLPPASGAYALHVLDELNDGWIAVTDVPHRRGFGVVFDHRLHRAVWQWMVYGDFRGWYHAIVEPWIAGPPALADAVDAGQARSLDLGQVLETRMSGILMSGILYDGVTTLSHLAADGTVVGESGEHSAHIGLL